MKFLYYYANGTVDEPYRCEQPSPEKLATCQLTQHMVGLAIHRHACGQPPYRLYVPKSILHEAHTWDFPTTLLQIAPKQEEDGDISVLATAELLFEDTVVFIHARRCLPFPEMGSTVRDWGNCNP